ncbi:cadherin [Acrasis kona]|uniref:Cadherin n=1 Tax=Acrasis kona TaxID=1008807 RepID=A0AAW2ZQ14_9EUKA
MGAYTSNAKVSGDPDKRICDLRYIAVMDKSSSLRLLDENLNDCFASHKVKSKLRFVYGDAEQVKFVSEKNLYTISLKDGSMTTGALGPNWKLHSSLFNGYFIGEKEFFTGSTYGLFSVFDERKIIYEIKPDDEALWVVQILPLNKEYFAVSTTTSGDEEPTEATKRLISVYSVNDEAPQAIMRPNLPFLTMQRTHDDCIEVIGTQMYEKWNPFTGTKILEKENGLFSEGINHYMGDGIIVRFTNKHILFYKDRQLWKEFQGCVREEYSFSEYDWQFISNVKQIDEYVIAVQIRRIYGKCPPVNQWGIIDIRDEPLELRLCELSEPKIMIRRVFRKDYIDFGSLKNLPFQDIVFAHQ